MTRLLAVTTAAERLLIVFTAALVLALHLGGMLAPQWLVAAIPLGVDVQPLLPPAQLILLIAWTILGPGRLWVRLVAAPALAVVLAAGWAVGSGGAMELPGNWLVTAGIAAAALALSIRCCGQRLAASRPDSAKAPRHPQFSIRMLIILTTLVAVVLGILESLRPMLRNDQELSMYLERLLASRLEAGFLSGYFSDISIRQYVLAAAVAGTSLAALWCVLRPGAMWLRLIVAAVCLPLLGIYLANLSGGARDVSVNLAIGLTTLAAIVGLSVVPLRLAGVRLARPRRTGFKPVLSKISEDRLKTCPTKDRLKTCPTELVPETVS